MKKVMKLVWMVLFALPLVTMTACGDDDDEPVDGVYFKDYSDLLNKTRNDVLSKMNIAIDEEQSDENVLVYYGNLNQPNIEEVDVLFTFFNESEYGGYVTYEKSVWVDVNVLGYTYSELYNYLTDKYGKGEMNEDEMVIYKKGNMYVWLDQVATTNFWVSYVNKDEWDKANNTKAVPSDFFKTLKAKHRK